MYTFVFVKLLHDTSDVSFSCIGLFLTLVFSLVLFCKLFVTWSYTFKLASDINVLKKIKYILRIGLSVYSDLRTYISAYITYIKFNCSSIKQLRNIVLIITEILKIL